MWLFNKSKKEDPKELEDRILKSVKEDIAKDFQAYRTFIANATQEFSDAVDAKKAEVFSSLDVKRVDVFSCLDELLETINTLNASVDAKTNGLSARAHEIAGSAKKVEIYAADAKKSAESAEASIAKIAEAAQSSLARFDELEKKNAELRRGTDDYLNSELKKIELAAVSAYNANIRELQVTIDGKVKAAISSLKQASKADYESIKAICIEDLRRIFDDCWGKVQGSVADFEKRKNDVLLFYAVNFRGISYSMCLSPQKKSLLIELHVSYDGSYDSFVLDKQRQAKNSRNGAELARHIVLLKDVVDAQNNHHFSAKELLCKFDESFRQAYDAAVQQKQAAKK